jgi:xylulokinase
MSTAPFPPRHSLGLANPIVPGMAGPMLAWLARNEPARMRAARWAIQPKDWLRYQITGEMHSEPSDASATLLYDLPADGWDTALSTRSASTPSCCRRFCPVPRHRPDA